MATASSSPPPTLPEQSDGQHIDWHCHTRWSDGEATIAQLAAAAVRQGFTAGVSDHGLRDNRRLRSSDQVRAYQDDLEQHDVLRGIEISVGDVAGEAGAPYPEHLLDELDYVIASLHVIHIPQGAVMATRYLNYRAGLYPSYRPSLSKVDRQAYFAAWLGALDATCRRWPVRILGHFCILPELTTPSGDAAMAGEPEPDAQALSWLDETIRLCVRHDVAIELNAKSRVPHEAFVRRAAELGARFSLGSDAHPLRRAGNLSYGRQLIRRLQLPPHRLLGVTDIGRLASAPEQGAA